MNYEQPPVFRPSWDEFRDFPTFLESIEDQCQRSGCCKVIPPQGWKPSRDPSKIYSSIDSMEIPMPTRQVVDTIKPGVFQLFHEEVKPLTVAAFKQLIQDDSKHVQAPKVTDPSHPSEQEIDVLEREMWRSLRFRPALYGSDTPGSLFDNPFEIDENKDEEVEPGNKDVWNLRNLGDLLARKLRQHDVIIPGINEPYLYFGSFKSTFCWHAEDLDLYSINYMHVGCPKVWFGIPMPYKSKFEKLCIQMFPDEHKECSEFIRHKMTLISPSVLQKSGIPVSRLIQYPGEFIITWPGAYHAGFNSGFNCAEAVNFGTARWVETGRTAKRCMCIQDSVRINFDMFHPDYDPELGHIRGQAPPAAIAAEPAAAAVAVVAQPAPQEEKKKRGRKKKSPATPLPAAAAAAPAAAVIAAAQQPIRLKVTVGQSQPSPQLQHQQQQFEPLPQPQPQQQPNNSYQALFQQLLLQQQLQQQQQQQQQQQFYLQSPADRQMQLIQMQLTIAQRQQQQQQYNNMLLMQQQQQSPMHIPLPQLQFGQSPQPNVQIQQPHVVQAVPAAPAPAPAPAPVATAAEQTPTPASVVVHVQPVRMEEEPDETDEQIAVRIAQKLEGIDDPETRALLIKVERHNIRMTKYQQQQQRMMQRQQQQVKRPAVTAQPAAAAVSPRQGLGQNKRSPRGVQKQHKTTAAATSASAASSEHHHPLLAGLFKKLKNG